MAYIDSEMARKRQAMPESEQGSSQSEIATKDHMHQGSSTNGPPKQAQQHQLAEVDLGSVPLSANKVARDMTIRRPPKPRLGRDGKPLPPRPRKRRNSEDMARDDLVERVLHEHRLENVYGNPESSIDQDTGPDMNRESKGDTDAAFAERFQQHFLDQAAQRKQAQQQKKSTAPTGPADKTQGPKLGGSRAARAKMAAMQQGQGGVG